MFLSRSRGEKLQGTLQMDMTYATIPVFGQQIILYRETLMKYMVRIQEKPHNYPLYYVHSDLDSFILYNDRDIDAQVVEEEKDQDKKQEGKMESVQHKAKFEPFWNMSFDGSYGKLGSGEGVWVCKTGNNHIEGNS